MVMKQQKSQFTGTFSLTNYQHLAAPPSTQSSSGDHNQLCSGGGLQYCIDTGISSSGKAHTMVSKIKMNASNYQFISAGHILPSSANRE